jgi:hypothetical protein
MTEIRMKSGSSSTACGFAAWAAQHAAKPQAATEANIFIGFFGIPV